MEEASASYKNQIEECDKLQAELDKVRVEYEDSKKSMEVELQELRQNVTSMSESKDTKEAENTEIHGELVAVKAELDESEVKLKALQEDFNNMSDQR